ncbi:MULTISPECIES: hypothetical protein [unclassified Streptomyces]|uniref:hypothetical protein n=1 Tax=unclassified Streptomyces TaxID=2593676 RepID=UPI0036EE60BE
MSEKTCRGPECDRPVRLKGLCASHGQQLWRHGGDEAALIPIGTYVKPGKEGCDFPECDRPYHAKGYCKPHYLAQWLGKELHPAHEYKPRKKKGEQG